VDTILRFARLWRDMTDNWTHPSKVMRDASFIDPTQEQIVVVVVVIGSRTASRRVTSSGAILLFF
jgi:hypothetical protein